MKIAALAGGVGAARLLSGLNAIVPPDDLSIVVNTGDDFEWKGLYVCPDLDTIVYTLAGIANPATGWGIRGDTFGCLERLRDLQCEEWFLIGDRDLATHFIRTSLLSSGKSLSEATRIICDKNRVFARVYPMTDSRVPTLVQTSEGILAFQDYFVRRKCLPRVLGFTFEKVEASHPAPQVLEALLAADAIIVCPSNPFISIGPILAVPGIRAALLESPARVLAVSPIIAGQAVKGPTAEMLRQMGMEVSPASVAALYREFLDILIVDNCDKELVPRLHGGGLQVRAAQTLMNDLESRVHLAREVLEYLR